MDAFVELDANGETGGRRGPRRRAVRERPSRTYRGFGHGPKTTLFLPAHHQLRIARIGLIRPVENEEGLSDMGHPDGAVAGNAVRLSPHLEDVAEAGDGANRRGPIALVGGEVDAGQIFHRKGVVIVLDPGTGAHRSEVQIADPVPVHEEIDGRRCPVAHQAELAALHRAVTVEIVPEPETAPGNLGLAREDGHVARVGPRSVAAEGGPVALETVQAHRGDRVATRDTVGQCPDDEFGGDRGSLEAERGAAHRRGRIDVIGGAVDPVVLEIAGVGEVGVVRPGERDRPVEGDAGQGRRGIRGGPRSGTRPIVV